MKKSGRTIILVILVLILSLLVFVACDDKNNNNGNGNNNQTAHTHTFSSDWQSDAIYHWHNATCEHIVVADKAYHTFDKNRICSICGYIDAELHGVEIKTNTLTLDEENISGKVPNDKTTFSFINEIIVADSATYTVSTDINGLNVIPTKTVQLAAGDNHFYILVQNKNDIKLYNVVVRRRPIYIVTFNSSGGTKVEQQQVEEDSFAVEPKTTRIGYDFYKWDYEFSQPITLDTTINASWNIIHYTIEYNLNGGKNNEKNPTTYTIEDEVLLSAPTKVGHTGRWSNDGKIEKGSTGNKAFTAEYTINQYKIEFDSENCNAPIGDGVYDYNSLVTVSVSNLYLGYDFSGWYYGETLLSKEQSYTFIMPPNDMRLTARTVAKEEMQNVIFESTIKTCDITDVVDKTLQLAVVPEYVTSIREYAFSKCKNLTCVIIPNSVTYIGKSAFFGCSSLESITIPFVGTSIYQDYPFGYIFGESNYSGSIETTQYYGGVNSIAPSGKYYIPSTLKNVTVTGGEINYGAFYNCSNLVNIVIPQDVKIINDNAFHNCSSLASIEIPQSVTSINYSAFCGCTGLTSVKIPDSVTSIGYGAFSSCNNITSIEIPDSVISIGERAFSRCSGLNSVTIGNSVKSLGDDAFSGCTSLTSVRIPDSVISIGESAFSGCSGLNSIVIGNGVKGLAYNTFSKCTSLTSIIIPDSVTSIGNYAFDSCSSLTSVIIGNGKVSIGAGAFYNCSSLINMRIGKGVTEIGRFAFEDCKALIVINYDGTMEQWNAISKDVNWNQYTGDYTIVCSDGTLNK